MFTSRERKQREVSPEQEHPKKAFGWAARDSSGVLSPFKFSRRYSFDLFVHCC
jgi:cinnamyl-alcohol dehydrogenase